MQSQWQPIETVPQDRYVLLCRKTKGIKQPKIVIAYWSDSEYCFKVLMTSKEVLNPIAWMDLPEPVK